MDLIIHKLLDDVLTLMADFWQALWNGDQTIDRDDLPTTAIKRGSSGTTHPIG